MRERTDILTAAKDFCGNEGISIPSIERLLLIALFLTLGCLGERQPLGNTIAPSGEAARVEPETMQAPMTSEELLSHIALKESDFPEGGWVPGPANSSKEFLEIRFFKVEFAYGEMTRTVNRVHLYSSPEDARKDFGEAVAELKETVALENAGIGDESVSWKKESEAYVIFVKKGVVVELYLASPGTYGREYLKSLARKIEERI